MPSSLQPPSFPSQSANLTMYHQPHDGKSSLKRLRLQRATSLPGKLDQGTPSRKLFWFRPKPERSEIFSDESRNPQQWESYSGLAKDARGEGSDRTSLQYAWSTIREKAHDEWCLDDDASGHTENNEDDDLLGLTFLEAE